MSGQQKSMQGFMFGAVSLAEQRAIEALEIPRADSFMCDSAALLCSYTESVMESPIIFF